MADDMNEKQHLNSISLLHSMPRLHSMTSTKVQ